MRIIYAGMREDDPPEVDLELHEYRVKGSRPNEPIMAPGWWKRVLIGLVIFAIALGWKLMVDAARNGG